MTSEIGKKLKETREQQNITLGEVALATKISPRVLKAIEEGDEAKLPPKTFLRGFVQTYASFLHLNVEEVMKQFHEEIGTTKPQPVVPAVPQTQSPNMTPSSPITPKPAPTPKPVVTQENPAPVRSEKLAGVKLESQSIFIKIALTTVGLALLIASIIAVKRKMEQYEAEGVIKELPPVTAIESTETTTDTGTETETSTSTSVVTDVATPATTSAPATSLSTGTAVAEAKPALPAATATTSSTTTVPATSTTTGTMVTTSPAAKPTTSTVTSIATGTTTSAKPVTSTSTATGTQTAVAPKPPPVTPPTATLSTTSTASKPVTPPPTTAAPVPATKPVTTGTGTTSGTTTAAPAPAVKPVPRQILIEALGPVTVEATINGKTERYTLNSDDVRTIRADRPVKLRISNAGAVNISKDGKDLGVPGSLGQALEVEY